MFAFGRPARRGAPIGFFGATEVDVVTHLGGAFELVEVRRGEESRPGQVRLPAWYRMIRRSPSGQPSPANNQSEVNPTPAQS
jgi:hypothetical protein